MNKVLKSAFIILVMLAIGTGISLLINGFIPGSVIGMILMFLSLVTGVVKPDDVRPVAEFLTKNMAILFVPSAIGIMDQWALIKVNFVAWILIIVISTILVMVSTGWTQDLLGKLFKKGAKKGGQNA